MPPPDHDLTAALVARHDLEPHPEGGWYRRVWTDPRVVDAATGRHAASAILFLLDAGQASRWHRVVDADEHWELVEGGPVAIEQADPAEGSHQRVELAAGRGGTHLVPAGWWQRSTATGAPALCRCTVTPEFLFDAFELADEGWSPVPPD